MDTDGKPFDWVYAGVREAPGEEVGGASTRQVLVVNEQGAELQSASLPRQRGSGSLVSTMPLTERQRDLLRVAVRQLAESVRSENTPAGAWVAGELEELEGLI